MAIRSFPKINYENIVSEALHLRIRWIQMKQLMAQSQDRVECMDWYASSFFSYAISSMEHSNVMAVGRMMDRKRGVLSIPKLLREIESNLSNQQEHSNFALVTSRLEKLEATCAPILERRHKRIAHPTNLEIIHDPLMKDWNETVEEIGLLIRDIGSDFGDFEQGGFDNYWYEFAMKGTDADALMERLESLPEWVNELERRRTLDAYLSSFRDSGS